MSLTTSGVFLHDFPALTGKNAEMFRQRRRMPGRVQESGDAQEWSAIAPAKARDGNQTLARGLRVLLAVADSKDGLTVQQVGEVLGVHRSIAYRLLQTLADFGLAARRGDTPGLAAPRPGVL